jgi:lactose/L-arabinose transport system substrate-binding protein
MKQVLGKSMVFAVAAGLLAGVIAQRAAPGTDPQKGSSLLQGEISVYQWAENDLKIGIPGFNALYPNIKVNLRTIPYDGMYDKMAGIFATGNPLEMGDVIYLESERMEQFAGRYPNAFHDLTEWGAGYQRSFDKSKWISGVVDGKLVGMPTNAAPVGMWYRADMFQKAGVDPKSIVTWDQYISVGKRVMAANPGVKMTMLLSETNARAMVQQQGAFYFDDVGRITINTPRMRQSLKMVKAQADAGLFAVATKASDIIALSKSNKVATLILPVWMAGLIKTYMPEQKGLWGALPMPAFAQGGGRSASIGGGHMGIAANSKNKEAAWAFVEYMSTFGAEVGFQRGGTWPSFLPALKNEVIERNDEFFATPEIYAPFKLIATRMRALRYGSDFDKAKDAVFEAQMRVLTQGVSVETALTEAAEKLAQTTKRDIARD